MKYKIAAITIGFWGCLGIFILGGAWLPEGTAQVRPVGAATLDPTTQKSLEQLRQLISTGTREQVEEQIKRIINSSGYILPLAEINYKSAQNESDAGRVLQYYKTIIDYWPTSAWAQKAAAEAVPLILMSGGTLGKELEPLMWERSAPLSIQAADAGTIGEDPEMLRSDVVRNLLLLAHYRNDNAKIQSLAQRELPFPESDLAFAFTQLRAGRDFAALDAFQNWLRRYPISNLRPYALVGLYHSEKNSDEKSKILERLSEEYPDTLESVLLRGAKGATAR